jgi:two-component sensor histidine kinase
MELPSLSSSADEPVLLHELHHRVNNEFAAAISVVSLAAARSSNDEVKTALASVTELLHHFASVHHALQVPERGDAVLAAEAYLSKLCLSISRSYLDHKNIKLSLAIEPLLLPADVSWRLGMIVYELIINGMRHAFAAGGGEIHVSVRRYAGFVKCIVRDDGSAAPNIRPGRGLKIVEALSNSLGGRLRQTFGPRGSTTMLVFSCGANSRRGAAAEKDPVHFAADAARQQTAEGTAFAMCR